MEKDADILLIDKPKGITSFDVIRLLRKKLGIRKMGHSGTLDPLATGLLLIGVGAGTKKLTSLIGLPKTYEAEILLGKKTDTGDITGNVIEEKDIPLFSKEDVRRVLEGMVGEHMLTVPLYSAIKKDGKALYAYAREGLSVEAPQKPMRVIAISLIDANETTIKVFFEVSSGTYIRTLAELIAERLGTLGTIANLRRLSVGMYNVKDAESI